MKRNKDYINYNKNSKELNIEKNLDQFSEMLGYKKNNLSDLVKRYYNYLGFIVRETEGLLEIYKPNSLYPEFKYVFDHKSSLRYPEAELITYNNKKLEYFINEISKKGRIAKAFIPFEFDPIHSFDEMFNNFFEFFKISSKKYVINGEIESLGYYIKYIPFLIFLLKVQIKSIESIAFIEKPIIPLIDPDRENINFDVNHYKNQLIKYFDKLNPDLTNKMPIKGEILEVNEKTFANLIHKTISDIELSTRKQKTIVMGRLNEVLRKELDIVENYYKQRIEDIQARIISANERNKKETLIELKTEFEMIKKERDFKINEYKNIYQINSIYDLIGASMIYVPAIFYFNCKITSDYGILEKKFEYDIFNNRLIPIKCSCGKPILQGKVCQNLHLSRLKCSYQCYECNNEICDSCNMNFCSACGLPMCAEHSYECENCKKLGRINKWICKIHLLICEECGKNLCPECGAYCLTCGKEICRNNNNCGIECKICNRYTCVEHSVICTYCENTYCSEDTFECRSCHEIYCRNHISIKKKICSTCSLASREKFYNFIRNNKAKLELPEFILPKTTEIIELSIKRKKYKIPLNQQKIKMGENRQIRVFVINKNTDKFIIIYNKKTEEEIMYRTPKFLGKFINIFKKNKIGLKIIPNQPIVITPKRKYIEIKKPTCPLCKKSFSEDYKICPYCGEQLKR